MKIQYFISAVCFALALTACDEDKLDPSIIEIPDYIKESNNPTEQFIYTNLVQPYNINVIYKWDYTQTDLSKNLVPSKEEFVIPFLNTVIQAWINPYVEIGGKSKGSFIFPSYVPKEVLLIGSPGYNNDGTVTQGTAEGGKKIVLYEINKYDPKNKSVIQRYFHVMHHEFAHILHQTCEFSPEYQYISAGLYTSTWYLKTDADAREEGFITNYAMSEYHEDFVEMVAMMLTRSKEEWDTFMEKMPISGKSQLQEKERQVISYFKDKWNIDIFELQAIIQKQIDEYLNGQNKVMKSPGAQTDILMPYFSYKENHICQHKRIEWHLH